MLSTMQPEQKYILCPTIFGGDQWHLAVAALLDKNVKLVMMTTPIIHDLYNHFNAVDEGTVAKVKALIESPIKEIYEDFLESDQFNSTQGLKKNLANLLIVFDDKIKQISTIPMEPSLECLLKRNFEHLQQTKAFVDLMENKELQDSFLFVSANQSVSNTYPISKKESMGDLKELTLNCLNNFPEVVKQMKGKIVGGVHASTAVLVESMRTNAEKTLQTMKTSLSPIQNDEEKNLISSMIDNIMDKASGKKIVFLHLREANYNKEHNGTTKHLEQLIAIVHKHNEKHPDDQIMIQPIGKLSSAIEDQEHNPENANDHINGLLNNNPNLPLLPIIDVFDRLDEMGNTRYPVLTERRYITEFWKQMGEHPNFKGMIGGRSGAFDIAAFMIGDKKKSLCWDIPYAINPEHLSYSALNPVRSFARLVLTAGGNGLLEILPNNAQSPGEFSEQSLDYISNFIAGNNLPYGMPTQELKHYLDDAGSVTFIPFLTPHAFDGNLDTIRENIQGLALGYTIDASILDKSFVNRSPAAKNKSVDLPSRKTR